MKSICHKYKFSVYKNSATDKIPYSTEVVSNVRCAYNPSQDAFSDTRGVNYDHTSGKGLISVITPFDGMDNLEEGQKLELTHENGFRCGIFAITGIAPSSRRLMISLGRFI